MQEWNKAGSRVQVSSRNHEFLGRRRNEIRNRYLLFTALILLCFSLRDAAAMMSPDEYRAARTAASHWLQLRIDAASQPASLPGVCIVHGEVTRTFRGPPLVSNTIDLEIECKRRGERSPPGDEFRVNIEDLASGRFLEAFATLRDGRFAVVARQVELVAHPAAKPTFMGKE